MNSVVTSYETPALVFSIIGLSLAVLVQLLFHKYFRALDFMQMSFLFGLAMYNGCFSTKLNTSMVDFNKNFLGFCETGDLVCTIGFPLSFGAVLIGFLLIVAIFIALQRCCGRPNLEIEPIYSAFKGFFKWFYLPCTYTSAYFLVKVITLVIDGPSYKTLDLIEAAAIGGFCLLFPIIQLIGYKCIQKQQLSIWPKWLQFFDYLRLMATGTLLGLYNFYKSQIYLHCVMITLILYPIIHLWKGQFKYPILERILYGLGQGAFLTSFYIFKYGPQYIGKYDIDFFAIGIVLILDFFLYTIRAFKIFCYGTGQGFGEVNPEGVLDISLRHEKSKNKYEHDSGQELQQSRESVNLNKATLRRKK